MKEIPLQGGPLNRCTLCRAKKQKERTKEETSVFCPLLMTFPAFFRPEALTLQTSARILSCRAGSWCRRAISKEGGWWTSRVLVFRWPNLKCLSQIHLSFSTWSQIPETENSRSGITRGKLRVFSHCPPSCFEDSTSWPIPGKSLQPYVSEEDFLEVWSQQMTVPQL